jgi:uncharacterized protein (DUF427 family)
MLEESNRSRIEPFDGIVNVRFSDAVIASSDKALILRQVGQPPVYFLPFRDIYFDFLSQSETRIEGPAKVNWWNVSAVGESAPAVMWSYEATPPGLERLFAHGSFQPDKVTIDVSETPDKAHQVRWP